MISIKEVSRRKKVLISKKRIGEKFSRLIKEEKMVSKVITLLSIKELSRRKKVLISKKRIGEEFLKLIKEEWRRQYLGYGKP